MNDTETRLRDYFEAVAATVPSTAHGPGLPTAAPRRPALPILMTAAAVAAILLLTVTFLNRVSADTPTAVGPSAMDAPPTVPYIVNARLGSLLTKSGASPSPTSSQLGAVLYDGTQTVRIPEQAAGVGARFGDGWLTLLAPVGGAARAAVLRPDGSVRALGPTKVDMPLASPDRSQIAVVRRPKATVDDSGEQVIVLDGRTGDQAAIVDVPQKVFLILGWTKAGIWGSSDIDGRARLFLWQPGDSAFRTVSAPAGFTGAFAASAGSDTVAVETLVGNTRCLQAGVLRSAKLDVQRKDCAKSERTFYPVTSADGRTLLNSERKLAIDITTGRTTQLKVPGPIISWPKPVFEDGTRVLVVTQGSGSKRSGPQQLHRCDVTTGDCKLLRTEADKKISLVQP